jgi:hypothetical protein
MKKTDIAMLILIVAVSAGIAYFVAHSIFGNMTEKGQTVKTVDPITSQVEAPDSKIFNENAINPSVEVNIDNSTPAASTSANTPAAESAAPTE